MEANEDRLVDIRTNSLHLRLAETLDEVEAAQALRYRIFYEGTAAKATEEMAALKRDFDAFDDYCDHLLVFDRSRGDGPEAVIGTYRLMRREAAERCGRFYTEDEYDIANLLNFPGDILELGRSCIAEKFRTGPTMQLLWRGVVEYVLAHDVGLLFGCASLPGVEPDRLALQLSFLYHHHLAPPALRTWALPERYVAMNRIPPEEFSAPRVMRELPPLLKGYLRVGGFIGEGAVVDYDFGTTDVCVVVKTEWMAERYYRHFVRDDAGKAAGVS
ncbi:MAG: GNAT family N-acetyltransferase [Proteobacteria bacterium]|nr:GNAT family N-acetyltransferase [Pseudomonadota bacterium]MCH8997769.1 GNAT family N-acetyltransferase [Pseudomonadota bacterium]